MKLHSYLPIIVLICISSTSHAKLVITAHGRGAYEYWLIYDDDKDINKNLVVFLHGYGASNPGCYGGWIKSLTEQGNAVVFPKFQIGTFLPRTNAFTHRTEEVIRDAKTQLRSDHQIDVASLILIGHSIGGVIASNIANNHNENGLHVSGLALCQPGFKYLKLGAHDTYNRIDSNALLMVITGEKDHAAGRKFASHVYESAHLPTNKTRWIEHQEVKTESLQLSAHHKDPVSPLKELDSRNRNLVISGAYLFCETDLVDQNAYWNPSIDLIHAVNSSQQTLELTELPDWIVSLN